MLTRTQRHVAELELGRQEAEHKAPADASLRARETRAGGQAAAALEGKVERLRRKYRRNMAKMYQHLSEREAYEQKLKSYIEHEVGALQQYNQELEDYCRRRRWRRLPSRPPLPRLRDEEEDEEEEDEESEGAWCSACGRELERPLPGVRRPDRLL